MPAVSNTRDRFIVVPVVHLRYMEWRVVDTNTGRWESYGRNRHDARRNAAKRNAETKGGDR